MSECCSIKPEADESLAVCPECGQKGQPVLRMTVEHLLNEQALARLREGEFFFCRTPDCEVVYFSNDTGQVFTKQDVRVRVGRKEAEPPIPVCYCFDYTRERIFEEIRSTGQSSALPYITAKVKAGECSCEIKNPSGRCCLGDVKKTVQEGLASLQAQPEQAADSV
ncbi:MAG: hypothetical protein D6743_17225 [Calditrichaeota bacterium]|nr:MAG: hypothetical protein D6743_17225 [Calditrichota bacterium]